jgi:hypothetical protein
MILYDQVKKLFEKEKPDDVLSCVQAVLRDELGLVDVSDCIKDARELLEDEDEDEDEDEEQ